MCLGILEGALLLLRKQGDLPETECELNRRLFFCLLEANHKLFPKNDIAPISECNNQPDPDDETRTAREHKRPDFQWVFIDRYEMDVRRSSKQFVVECKRLGKPARANWVFNINYVGQGICRFRDPQWSYAQRFPSGVMVGYLRQMESGQVLKEVNDESRKMLLPELMLIGAWNFDKVNHLEHSFERSFDVSPFQIRHLWIQLE
jgi:hypothetical protein